MKKEQFFKRFISFPFILILLIVVHIWDAVRGALLWLINGGEIIGYSENQPKTIMDIYEFLEQQYKLEQSKEDQL